MLSEKRGKGAIVLECDLTRSEIARRLSSSVLMNSPSRICCKVTNGCNYVNSLVRSRWGERQRGSRQLSIDNPFHSR